MALMTFLCVYKSKVLCGEGTCICSLVHPRVGFIRGCWVKISCTHAAPDAGDWAVKSAAQYYLRPPVWRGPQLNGRLHFACRIVPEHTHGTLGFDQCTPLTPTVGAFSLVSGGISIHSGWGLYLVEGTRFSHRTDNTCLGWNWKIWIWCCTCDLRLCVRSYQAVCSDVVLERRICLAVSLQWLLFPLNTYKKISCGKFAKIDSSCVRIKVRSNFTRSFNKCIIEKPFLTAPVS